MIVSGLRQKDLRVNAKMRKNVFLVALSLIGVFLSPLAVRSETVMEKIARTGTLTIGTQTDAIPYSYVNDRDELVGYSIDMIEQIRAAVEEHLGKPIKLQVVTPANFANSIENIETGKVDLACNTAFTWERDRIVDFSVSYALSGIRLLVPSNSTLGSPESLAGKRIGVQQQTIAESTIKLIQPGAILIPIGSVEDGLKALAAKQVDALAGDRIALAGINQTLKPNAYKITPEQSYANFAIACMFPQNNSSFANLVNHSLVKVMQGYVIGDPASVALIDRWFGKDGIVKINPELIKAFFEGIILTREQIPFPTPSSSTKP
jgi:polar amino acid transport system substrate-binding protein